MSIEAYREARIATDKPEDQISLLFEGWLVALNEAELAIERGQVPEAHQALIRGQNLAGYLWSQVNPKSPFAAETEAVLAFLQQEMVRANVEKSKERVIGVREVVVALAEAWQASREAARR
jgi:flagellar protein FliS